MDTSSVANNPTDPYAALNTKNAASTTSAAAGAADTQDRFLKLLVAQMQNQDPMNPMDNAQVTTQLAQIQTVTGIDTLNTSIGTLGSQFTQMQALQGVSLMGHDVSTQGNQLNMIDDKGEGGYQLSSASSATQLDVLNAAGAVVYTEQLGPQGTGMQTFNVPADQLPADTSGLTFKITATSPKQTITATTYAHDRVVAVNTNGTTLSLQLQTMGNVPYASVTAVD
ncbi:flagellar hook capping FlgD N-terminal domain-containing protein [Paucibacter sp. R3-3]|uniref:Basal-body rod modification protein FlgD n=1 Tax=Roseateles agri TaxID=3098619 RepID=A0ABU5DRL4_9BURK|nr:flagellar hook capping FlgD N-terminal domain-containing protein [Paucibacter sp. R3-3]MDY0748351.1 flagellar hook capping FlgD N-terminal domain-containing protein [Paucibacter sp. R3-3]